MAERMVKDYNVGILAIDYFQLIRCSQRGLSEIGQVNYISQELKKMSTQLAYTYSSVDVAVKVICRER